MEEEKKPKHKGLRGFIERLFFDKKFAFYTGIGIFISALTIALLWLLIDVLHIHTVIAGVITTGVAFILRYILFDVFKILRDSE